MAGLLAWAADVVGGGGGATDDLDEDSSIPLVFTPDQQKYVQELDQKAASLSRSIQDLRLRIPPPDISQRLPHLHAHSLASNAALALQLNSHSATREQAQLREVTLQEENAAYEKANSDCENKIQEKIQEAEALRKKLQDIDEDEKNLMDELESAHKALDTNQSGSSDGPKVESLTESEGGLDAVSKKAVILENIENKKKELSLMEEKVQELEKRWMIVQDHALKQPSPAQREKILDKQLHSLIEQLATKQAQAEALVNDIHLNEKELERLNGLSKRLGTSNMEATMARNRFGRSNSGLGSASLDYTGNSHGRPLYGVGRNESLQRPALLRSAFVLYLLTLHVLVFIKISF
ncbi:hypothetical protein CDL15_Pgr027468 [Punica granatum]|uniref:Uncharacterized protein n=1 Tax=Punica granatum TaxID=22663 RepID=A0A218XJM7_PUNGR|nr:hypothetical protein CDL15_Pgr027468 [Punica granatum]PKI69896.1 hypothetical protein CRG98_009771 [Punica granatum]